MVVNDNAGNLTPRGALSSIASKLAPTVKTQAIPKKNNQKINYYFLI
jgi:hypothetical protein